MTEHLILLRQRFYLVNLMFRPYKFILPYKVIFHEEEKKKFSKSNKFYSLFSTLREITFYPITSKTLCILSHSNCNTNIICLLIIYIEKLKELK